MDQLITLEICARNFLFFKKCVETPIFIVLCDKQCFEKTNLDQLITLKTPKLGPVNNSTAYMYTLARTVFLEIERGSGQTEETRVIGETQDARDTGAKPE